MKNVWGMVIVTRCLISISLSAFELHGSMQHDAFDGIAGLHMSSHLYLSAEKSRTNWLVAGSDLQSAIESLQRIHPLTTRPMPACHQGEFSRSQIYHLNRKLETQQGPKMCLAREKKYCLSGWNEAMQTRKMWNVVLEMIEKRSPVRTQGGRRGDAGGTQGRHPQR